MNAGAPDVGAPPRLGVIVPARNEAWVIERKLRNLAAVRWPAGEHRLVVVDDESDDGTAERARRWCAELFAAPRTDGARIDARVVANDVHPGKVGAIRSGLRELAHAADIAVLTDADVVLDREALPELARAFELDSGLGMACGSQIFLRVLADDGSWPAGPVPRAELAAGLYDRITARVRRLESRFGALFSVHGQLLAWRTALGVTPTIGIAADDLDLMIQVRQRGACVRLVPDARFFEQKTPAGPVRDDQALRRARAYVQVVRAHRNPFGGHWKARAQWAFYRRMPLALGRGERWFPLAWAAAYGAVIYSDVPMQLKVYVGLLFVSVVMLWSRGPTVRRMRALLDTIDRARRLERGATLTDRWEMRRA